MTNKSLLHRYANEMINPAFYGRVIITNGGITTVRLDDTLEKRQIIAKEVLDNFEAIKGALDDIPVVFVKTKSVEVKAKKYKLTGPFQSMSLCRLDDTWKSKYK